MESKALGKGLSALITANNSDVDENEKVAYVQTSRIINNQFQPRTNYDDSKLDQLKASIKDKGVLQPILIREHGDNYEVVAGERRLRAARDLNFETVPAIIKNVTDQEALVIALVENIQREELNPIEEAQAYKQLIEDFNYTQEDVAKSVAKDRSTVSNLMRLLKLPEDVKKSVYNGELSAGHARALVAVESAKEQKKYFKKTLKDELSVRALEQLIAGNSNKISRRTKVEKEKSRAILALEEALQKALGTKVSVDAKEDTGKIIIDYYSLEDLERILDIIKNEEKR